MAGLDKAGATNHFGEMMKGTTEKRSEGLALLQV
jgi:hypothetical protein